MIARNRPLLLILGLSLAACARGGTPILDRQAILARQTFLDNRDVDWYSANIPFFE